MKPDPSGQTAADLGRAIGRGAIDPIDLCEFYLDAIAAHEASGSVFSTITASRAREEAHAASHRAKHGTRRGLLDGVPVSWKDLFDLAGTRTEAGTRLLSGRTPSVDAAVVSNATRAGVVTLGKCHMSELAFSGLGLNPMTATAPNALDVSRAPGGSSSGSAASVALGLAAASIGSDTGGSVRIPAAWNGLVGLKTSCGTLPLNGAVPLCRRFDTVGPICRSVEDAALLLSVLAGKAARPPETAPVGTLKLLSLNVEHLGPSDPTPSNAFSRDIEKLRKAGAHVAETSLEYIDDAFKLSGCLYTAEAYGLWRDAIESSPDSMFGQIKSRFATGASFSGPDYVAAWDRMNRLRRRFAADCSEYDAILLPATANSAPKISRLTEDDSYYAEQNLLALRNTRIANLFDYCAITLPNDTQGCGLMLMAPPGQEIRLLQIAHGVERMITN